MGLFGINLLRCEYSKKCTDYKEDSFTCTKADDKRYCGAYRRFLVEGIHGVGNTTNL